ncbi:hypothetical protein L3C95_25915 [Chitinophaga filiformis]|uniref:hypothetical protein n=1 Tax=Chitinophaga filiformis TaxID=104663 RepID=UPI001F18E874|nr:hypothetical protein [Chitinophaga filiformis]MCF6406359.1 hypothetical protein [Chitinophaga filiformis]
MSRQTGFFPYSGKLKDRVGYYRKNKKGEKEWWTRQAAEHVRRTAATKRAATDFGTACRCSRLVRHALRPWLQYYGYHFDHNRLNKAFINLVKADTAHKTGFKLPTHQNMQSLRGFHFNTVKTTHDFLTGTPVITNENGNRTAVLLPGIHISNAKRYKGITHITVKAIALPFNFRQNTTAAVASETITIKRNNAPQPITLTLPASKEQTLIMLEIQCGYEINGSIVISPKKETAAIDIIAVLPARKTPKVKTNKTPQLRIIPLCCQTVKKHQSRRRVSVYPLKE